MLFYFVFFSFFFFLFLFFFFFLHFYNNSLYIKWIKGFFSFSFRASSWYWSRSFKSKFSIKSSNNPYYSYFQGWEIYCQILLKLLSTLFFTFTRIILNYSILTFAISGCVNYSSISFFSYKSKSSNKSANFLNKRMNVFPGYSSMPYSHCL